MHDVQDIVKNPDENKLTRTWSYHPRLSEKSVQYAQLYAKGMNLDDVCPSFLKEEWEKIIERHSAFYKSFRLSGVSTREHCFYDLVPSSFTRNYFRIKSLISEYVLNNFEKPKNYEDLVRLTEIIDDIKGRNLNIDFKFLNRMSYNDMFLEFSKKIRNKKQRIKYNIFGTVTGRLSCKSDSFPILNLKKEYRGVLKPNNDIFVELDFNGSQLRTLLALNDVKVPAIDIHNWNMKQMKGIYNEELTREQVKSKIFAWLYNPNSSLGIPKLESLYNKKNILDKWWDGKRIKTPFGDELESDEWHALNYLIQRTEATNFYRRVYEVHKLLKNTKSFVAALIHDSLLIDLSIEDKGLLCEIINTFGKTDLGEWKINCKVGNTFGNMKLVQI